MPSQGTHPHSLRQRLFSAWSPTRTHILGQEVWNTTKELLLAPFLPVCFSLFQMWSPPYNPPAQCLEVFPEVYPPAQHPWEICRHSMEQAGWRAPGPPHCPSPRVKSIPFQGNYPQADFSMVQALSSFSHRRFRCTEKNKQTNKEPSVYQKYICLSFSSPPSTELISK